MNENIVASGDNYIVTTRCKFPGKLDSLSILMYNFDENIVRSLKRIGSQEDLLRISRHYDEEAEFLIRCNGFDGEFRIIRWRLDAGNVMRRIETSINPRQDAGARETLISELSTDAAVSAETFAASDALSIRAIFKGIGAELVLIDSK